MANRNYYLIFFLSFIIMAIVAFNRVRGNPQAVIWSDAEGYYVYLPGLFILKDFHDLPPGSMWPYYNAQGEFVNKYTCGIAYFELPFFAAGYLIHKFKGTDHKEYLGPVYSKAIAFGGILVTFLGLLLLYKTLIREYKEKVVAWTILAVYFGTNLFHYSTKEMGISHVYSFFLFAALLFHIPRYLKKSSVLNSVILGGLMGWIVLIRPTNSIVFLILLLYNVYSMEELRARITFFVREYKSLLIMAVAGFVMLIPQLLYWKEMTGNWIYYSYTEEGFKYWNKPKILAVLADVQNGLLLYSPMVILMLAGIFYGLKQKKVHAPAMLIIFIIATYLFASWWAWWFGGAFGHRSYVEYYALLSIPLAGLLNHVFASNRRWLPLITQCLLMVLMIYSVRLSYLYTSIGGPWDGADWRWNWDKYKWIMSHFFKFS